MIIRLYLKLLFCCLFLSGVIYAQTPWLDKLKEGAKNDKDIYGIKYENDTLKIASSKEFCYYPFGLHHSLRHLNRSIGNVCRVSNVEVYLYCDKQSPIDTLYRFTYGKSIIDFFYHVINEEKIKTLEVCKANIIDSKVKYVNGIHVGMSQKAFFKMLFKCNIPETVRNIEVDRALEGLRFYYNFKDNILIGIVIKSDFQYCEKK